MQSKVVLFFPMRIMRFYDSETLVETVPVPEMHSFCMRSGDRVIRKPLYSKNKDN